MAWASDRSTGCGCCSSTTCSGAIRFSFNSCCTDTPTITAVGPKGTTQTLVSYSCPYFDGPGVYSLTFSCSGSYPRTVTQSVVCGMSYNLGTIYLRPTSISVTVSSACGGLNGTTLTFGGVYSGVTASLSGIGPQTVTVAVPDIPGTGLPGNWTLTVAQPRYVSVFNTYTWTPYNCSVTVALTEYSDCYQCCIGCLYPTTDNLLLTGPIGSVALNSSAGSGTITYSSTAYPAPTGTGSCCSGATSTLAIPYTCTLQCAQPTVFEEPSSGPQVNISYLACLGSNTPTVSPCGYTGGGPFFSGLGYILWSSSTCQPYSWTGSIVMQSNSDTGIENPTPPELVGTWTLAEVPCSSPAPPPEDLERSAVPSQPPTPDPPEYPEPFVEAQPVVSFSPVDWKRIKDKILACPHRGPKASCGCNGTIVCLAGKGRPVPGSTDTDVTEDDCRRCVLEQERGLAT